MLSPAILVTNKTNIRYLCGFEGSHGYILLMGKKGFLFTDSRYLNEAKKSLPQNFRAIDSSDGFEKAWKKFLAEYRLKKIGIENSYVNLKFWKKLQKISKGTKLTDIGNALDKRRIIKTKDELEKITRSQKINEKVFYAIKRWLKPGISEKEIENKIEFLAREFGADKTAFTPIAAINEHSACPHHTNTNKRLKKGDMLLIDMGVVYQGYHSDMTRVLFTKTPTTEQQKIYGLTLKAQKTAIKKLRAGMTGKQIDSAARGVIKKAGFLKQFGHALGHGVGLDIHELPNLSKKYKDKIPAGAVITVEPGVYLPGKFGIRLEDMLVVNKKSARNLTRVPKSIQQSVIRLK